MKELSSRSLLEVHDIIHGQNYVNIKARLNQYLPADYANTFSNVNFFGSTGMWSVDDDMSLIRLKDASAEERSEAAFWLEECRNYLGENLADKMPYWKSLFSIPSEDQIFLYRNNNGEIRVVLTEWGFEPRMAGKKVDVIGILIDAPRVIKQEEVTIHIDYSDGTVASQIQFVLNSFNNTKTVSTDDNGDFFLGKIFASKSFSVERTDGLNHYDYIVEVGKSIYSAVFDYYVDYVISVENQKGEPKANYTFIVNGMEVQTDDFGQFVASLKLLPETVLRVKVVEKDHSFKLCHDSEQNRFVVRVDDPVVLPPPPPPVVEYITVTLLDHDGTPLSDQPFQIMQKKIVVAEGVTDRDGNARIQKDMFLSGKKYKIRFSRPDSYHK
ncbi:MAG: hypothetical protein IKV91_00330 [Bacteroidales bacterium]|nr:hypothetical protein [Bacteroidales bacterium]